MPMESSITPMSNRITDDARKRLCGKLNGLRLLIFDEVSMLSLEDLYEIHVRLCIGKGTDPTNLDVPFGGVHVVFAGDFFQLKPVGGHPIYSSRENDDGSDAPYNPTSARHVGYALWLKINEYAELTENVRHGNQPTDFARFNYWTRLGVHDDALRAILNERVAPDVEAACRMAKPEALWLAPTNAMVNERNNKCFEQLQASGAFHMRLFAQHRPSNVHDDPPDRETLNQLFKTTGEKTNGAMCIGWHVLDLAIGSRVACTFNFAPGLGLYQGALGTVVGFGFRDSKPPPAGIQSQSDYINGDDGNMRELPIVFVQMDHLGDSKGSLSCDPKRPRVVPFVALPSRSKLRRKYHRYQVPLVAAHCRTIHKAQGLTAKHGIVLEPSRGKPFAMSLEYVAISRACCIEDVILLEPLRRDHITWHGGQRRSIVREYRRLFTTHIIADDDDPPPFPDSTVYWDDDVASKNASSRQRGRRRT
jgi:hypothetical protein